MRWMVLDSKNVASFLSSILLSSWRVLLLFFFFSGESFLTKITTACVHPSPFLWFWFLYLTVLITTVNISRSRTKRTNRYPCPIPYSWIKPSCLLPLLGGKKKPLWNLVLTWNIGTFISQQAPVPLSLPWPSRREAPPKKKIIREAHQHGGKPRSQPVLPVWTKPRQL